MKRSKHVVVVGAGPGGLASSLLLAASGLRVTLLERMDRVGGRTSAMEMDGFRFDTGPTFFLYPRVLREICAAAGFDLDREVELIRLDPQYRIDFGAGGHLDATPDVRTMEREVAKISPSDAQSLSRFLADNRTKLEKFRPVLEMSFQSWRDLLRPEMLDSLPFLKPWRSLDADLKRYFDDERIRLAFSFQSKYLGMSPFRCPSLFSILSFLEYEYGVYHPVGGCAAVMEAMARMARRLGVDVRLQEPVRELAFDGRRVVGVHTDRAYLATDAVVVNADFARAIPKLIPDRLRRRWSNRKIDKAKVSCSTFMLYLGVDGVYEDLPHHTIHVARDYRRNLDEVENRHVLSDDPSFYVQNACVTDPSLAPRGQSTLYVLLPVTHQHENVEWNPETTARYRRLALDQVSRKLGLDDLEGRIRTEKILTPTDWDGEYEIHRGATFNLAHNFRQMLHLRPRNRFDDVDGVYLVGGGTHPGSGLPVIFESARISSRLLQEDLGVTVVDGTRAAESNVTRMPERKPAVVSPRPAAAFSKEAV